MNAPYVNSNSHVWCVTFAHWLGYYYACLHQTDKQLEKERNDETDYELIQEIFNRKRKICSDRFINMVLEKTKGICMNLKRIYRIMRKYNLVTKIRRANPYKHIVLFAKCFISNIELLKLLGALRTSISKYRE
ncbi:transposase [Bacillus cereus]|uniref:transposase n=1 Tax=Bacillus cereus TaxID=1396 RepID=UPI003830D149